MAIHLVKALVLVILLVGNSKAEQHRVTPETDLENLCGKVAAGDTIVLENGTWTDAQLEFASLAGTEESPVSIVAETPGKVVFTGQSSFRISGQHIIVSGFVFRDCFDVTHVLEMRSKKKEHANHCRITDCVFEQQNKIESTKDTKWLSIYGSNNRVDHCYFAGKTTLGTTLVVWISEEPERHRIDHNYFGPRPKLGQNGGETIRVGTSKVSEFRCETVVEDNYFFQCNGEAEIISNKSCENIYRHNVFEECAGALTLRHGHRCLVNGNVFLGREKQGTGGVRVIGEGHRVINNYFEGLRGERVRATVGLMNGIPDGPLNGYAPVKKAIVAHNTVIDCRSTFEIGVGAGTRKRTVVPEDCLLANNLVVAVPNDSVRIDVKPKGLVWKGNKQAAGNPNASQLDNFAWVKIRLRRTDGFLMRPKSSKTIHTEALTEIDVQSDVDGESRGKTPIAGCDQPGTRLRKFPSPADTGPSWWRATKK